MSDLHHDHAAGRLDPREAAAYRRLAADAAPPVPPSGLAVAAVARAFAALPTPRFTPRRAADLVFPDWLRRADTLVAAGIGFLAVGLVVAGVGKLRAERDTLACQDRLRQMHFALAGYGDTHDGRFPQVGTPTVPVAGAVAIELLRAGQLSPDLSAACPTAEGPAAGYAYTLGYRTPTGRLFGVRQEDATDWVPVAGDQPLAPGHPRGRSVLSVNGAVRFASVATIGVSGDDIYHNDAGLVRAGLHKDDTALGGPTDYP